MRPVRQAAISRGLVSKRFAHSHVVRVYPARVIGVNVKNLTVDVDLLGGGTGRFVRCVCPVAGLTHGRIALPRIGDLVIVSYSEASAARPMILGAISEPVVGGNPEIVGGQIGDFNRLAHLYQLSDIALDAGENVSRVPWTPYNEESPVARQNTWRAMAVNEEGAADPAEHDTWLEVHPAGNVHRVDRYGNIGYLVEGNTGLIARNAGGFRLEQEVRTQRNVDGAQQFLFLVKERTGETLLTLDPAAGNPDPAACVALVRAQKGLQVTTDPDVEAFAGEDGDLLVTTADGGLGITTGALDRLPDERAIRLAAPEKASVEAGDDEDDLVLVEADHPDLNVRAAEDGDISIETEGDGDITVSGGDVLVTTTADGGGTIEIQAKDGTAQTINIEADSSLTINCTGGNVSVTSGGGNVALTATGNITAIPTGFVQLGGGVLQKLMNAAALDLYNTHTHPDPASGTTGVPNQIMVPGTHSTVKTEAS